MRILYGVVGEGMGHAMRSRVILEELVKEHDVHVVVSGRAHDYLQQRASQQLSIDKIWGYSLVYEDNEVKSWKTLVQNAKGALSGWPANIRTYWKIVEGFQPDVVISDFESWSYLFGQRHEIPVVSVDNIQIVDRCAHPPELLEGLSRSFDLTKAIVRAKVAGAAHYHITTFFYPPVRKPDTSLHPPILRPEILAATPEADDHLLVYQTSTSNTTLPDILRRTGRECRIYGLRRDIQADLRDGNLRYRPFGEKQFIDDLKTAAGVVASAGFTLMGEAVYLRRPMLAVPVAKQFEQVLNARYLEREGYGLCADRLTSEQIGQFLERLPDFRDRLARYQQDGNKDLLAGVRATLARLSRR